MKHLNTQSGLNQYLLDQIVATATRAYSFRKLSSTYSGPSVKLGRSSDNSTTDVSFNSMNVVAGDSSVAAGGDLATWAGASTLVIDTWYDQGPSAINATQTTISAKPLFILNGGVGINNRPVARCTGSQYLTIATPINAATSLTFALITGNIIDRSVVNRIFNTRRGGDGTMMFQIMNAQDERIRTIYSQNGGSALLNLAGFGSALGANFSQYLLLAENSSLLIGTNYEKNAQIQTLTSASAWNWTTASNDYQLFANSTTSSFYIGDLPEFIYFTSLLSSADQTTVNQNQRSFYSLT